MASARTSQLLNQRGKNLYNKTGSIRLLSPANSALNTIAKKTAAAELDVMVSKYNSGLIGNQEMKDFLLKTQATPGISEADKLSIDEQLRDFDSRIQKDRLENIYKSAAPNSLAQIQAAQALSNYYKTKASGLQPDTPAYATLVDNASQYDNKIVSIQDSMQKTARTNQRYLAEQQINQIPNNTADRAYARSQMWKDLYNQANADGDVTAANQYAANYQQELTNAQGLAEKEVVRQEKDEITNIMNSYVDAYHDGRINESQYIQLLEQIAPRIDATGDYGLINSLNRTTDKIQKALIKGGAVRGTTAGGLPVVLKNAGGKGAGGGVKTDWDMEDFNYSDTLKQAFDDYSKGAISQDIFSQAIVGAIVHHASSLEEQITVLEETARANPNTKVLYHGSKRRVADVLDDLYKEQDNIQSQAQAAEKGQLGLVQIAPKEINKSGDVTATGKAFATFDLIDTNSLPKEQYVKDEDGVFHKIEKNQAYLTPDQLAQSAGGVFYDSAGAGHFVKTDSSGNSYIESGQKIKVYKPGTSEFRLVAPGGNDGAVPSYKSTDVMTKQDTELAKYAGQTIKSEADYQKALKISKEKFSQGLTQKNNIPVQDKSVTQLPVASAPVKLQPTTPSATLTPVEAPKIVAPINPVVPQNTPLNNMSTPTINPSVAVSQPIKQPTLKVVGNVQPNAIQKLSIPKQVNIGSKPTTSAQDAQYKKLMQTPVQQRGSLGPIDFLKQLLKIK